MSFGFLSQVEFDKLRSSEKLAYLSDAMDELERLKVPREVRRWDSLFTQPVQQQQQPQAKDDPDPK